MYKFIIYDIDTKLYYLLESVFYPQNRILILTSPIDRLYYISYRLWSLLWLWSLTYGYWEIMVLYGYITLVLHI